MTTIESSQPASINGVKPKQPLEQEAAKSAIIEIADCQPERCDQTLPGFSPALRSLAWYVLKFDNDEVDQH